MLTTNDAIVVLKAAKAASGANDRAGIRIAAESPDDSKTLAIGISITDSAQLGDGEFDQEGLRIFVEDSLIEPLNGRTLDVREAAEGPELIFR